MSENINVSAMTDEEVEHLIQQESKLRQESYEYAIAQRAKQEEIVRRWAESIKNLPEEVLSKLHFPQPLELRTFVPEVYKSFEEFDQEVCNAQYAEIQKCIDEYNQIASEYNRKQAELLVKVKQLKDKQ